MSDVDTQNLFFDTLQGGTDSGDLRNDVDAVAVLLDHTGEAAHLAFDTAETFQACRLRMLAHA
jgi:hypothetical protein